MPDSNSSGTSTTATRSAGSSRPRQAATRSPTQRPQQRPRARPARPCRRRRARRSAARSSTPPCAASEALGQRVAHLVGREQLVDHGVGGQRRRAQLVQAVARPRTCRRRGRRSGPRTGPWLLLRGLFLGLGLGLLGLTLGLRRRRLLGLRLLGGASVGLGLLGGGLLGLGQPAAPPRPPAAAGPPRPRSGLPKSATAARRSSTPLTCGPAKTSSDRPRSGTSPISSLTPAAAAPAAAADLMCGSCSATRFTLSERRRRSESISRIFTLHVLRPARRSRAGSRRGGAPARRCARAPRRRP